MKTIYIFLSKTDTVVSRLIHIVTNDAYTHSAISFDADLHMLYSFARKYEYSALPAGAKVESIDKGYFKHHKNTPCALYELHVTDMAYERAKKEVERVMIEQSKWSYNIIGLFLCKLQIRHNRDYKYFCSQFVGEVLTRSDALRLPKHTSLMKPNDFSNLPELKLLFQGRLCDLKEYMKSTYTSKNYGMQQVG